MIIRKIEPVNFVLQRSPKSKPFVVHVNKIKKCLSETPVSWVIPKQSSAKDTVGSLGSTSCFDVEPAEQHVQDHSVFDHISEPHSVEAGGLKRQSTRHRCPPQYLSEYVC